MVTVPLKRLPHRETVKLLSWLLGLRKSLKGVKASRSWNRFVKEYLETSSAAVDGSRWTRSISQAMFSKNTMI